MVELEDDLRRVPQGLQTAINFVRTPNSMAPADKLRSRTRKVFVEFLEQRARNVGILRFLLYNGTQAAASKRKTPCWRNASAHMAPRMKRATPASSTSRWE